MATYFLEQFFIWPDVNGGWSEGFYLEATSHQAAITKYTTTGGLGDKRAAMLGDWCLIDYLRVSDVAILGDAFHWAMDKPGELAEDTTHHRTDPWTALNIRVNNADRSRNAQFWLHGCAEEWFKDNRGYDPTNADNALLTAWEAKLTADGYSWRSKHKLDTAVSYQVPQFFDPRNKCSKKIGRPFHLLVGRRGKKKPAALTLAEQGSTFSGAATPQKPGSSRTVTKPP